MQAVRAAFSFALASAGSSIAARMAMIAITTSNSIKVKPPGRSPRRRNGRSRFMGQSSGSFGAHTRRTARARQAFPGPRSNRRGHRDAATMRLQPPAGGAGFQPAGAPISHRQARRWREWGGLRNPRCRRPKVCATVVPPRCAPAGLHRQSDSTGARIARPRLAGRSVRTGSPALFSDRSQDAGCDRPPCSRGVG